MPKHAFVTIFLVMKTESLAEIKANLSRYVDMVEGQHERVVLTRKGRPAAVILSVDDLESLEETLEVLSDPGLMSVIRESLHELTSPEAHAEEPTYSVKDVWRMKTDGIFDE